MKSTEASVNTQCFSKHYKSKGHLIMAKEIRETPILKGKDATRFREMIKDNERRKVSAEEYQKGQFAYEAFGFANR